MLFHRLRKVVKGQFHYKYRSVCLIAANAPALYLPYTENNRKDFSVHFAPFSLGVFSSPHY
jgi:hypothetical protein